MAKLYHIYEHPKERIKRTKSGYWKENGRNGRKHRFYSQVDMSIVKHDEAVINSQRKRGEVKDHPNAYISECGCGGVGCFIHSSFETREQDFYR